MAYAGVIREIEPCIERSSCLSLAMVDGVRTPCILVKAGPLKVYDVMIRCKKRQIGDGCWIGGSRL